MTSRHVHVRSGSSGRTRASRRVAPPTGTDVVRRSPAAAIERPGTDPCPAAHDGQLHVALAAPRRRCANVVATTRHDDQVG